MRTADMLREFHSRIPDYDHREVRWRLHFEEAGELEVALTSGDREAIARELGDVVYVCYGTALVYGIDLDVALDAIHAANMRKLGPDGLATLDRHGKVRKPKGWRPPDVKAALA